jgi:adenosylcobyric acid synthase
MAETVLIAGTASHVGKSTVAAGLCRRLANQGVSVAPFKAQNMSNNARAVLTPAGARADDARPADNDPTYGEIGVSQYVQATAAGVVPTTDHNPVLLKPTDAGTSQLVLQGSAVGHVSTEAYYDEYWERARAAAVDSYARLADRVDVIVAEGAGSIAEINLHDRDLANVETARFGDATILLVADIERGGAFASLVGTLQLMPADLRERVAGVVITKFRGDRDLLAPGIETLERRTGVPVLDVLPYDDPGLPEEDSLGLPQSGERESVGADGVSGDRTVTVAVPRLPRAANVTDVDPLARTPGVRVTYVPPDDDLAGADAVVVPGSKNPVDDLLALRERGLGDAVRAFEGPMVGICGGYQLLGKRIENASVESTTQRGTVDGLGRLPVATRLTTDKRVEQVRYEVVGAGPITGASGPVEGYEIHLGRTERTTEGPAPIGPASAATETVLGTYVHGLFENDGIRQAFLDRVFDEAGVDRPTQTPTRQSPYEAAAELVEGIDLDAIRSITIR